MNKEVLRCTDATRGTNAFYLLWRVDTNLVSVPLVRLLCKI